MTPLFISKPIFVFEYDKTIGTTVFECPDASLFKLYVKPIFEYKTAAVNVYGAPIYTSGIENGYRYFDMGNLSPGTKHLSAVFEGYSTTEKIVMKDVYQYNIESEGIIADIVSEYEYPIGKKDTLSAFTMTTKYKDSTTSEVLSTVDYEISSVATRVISGVVTYTCIWASTTPQEDPIPSKIKFTGKGNNRIAGWNSATFMGTALSVVCALAGTHEEPIISYEPYRYVAPIDFLVKKTSYGYA